MVFERVMEEEEENELAFSCLPPGANMLRRELWGWRAQASRCPPMLVQYGGAEVLAAESRNFVPNRIGKRDRSDVAGVQRPSARVPGVRCIGS